MHVRSCMRWLPQSLLASALVHNRQVCLLYDTTAQDELASASPDDLLPPATNLELKLLLPPVAPTTKGAAAAGPGAAGAGSVAAQGTDGARRLSASGSTSAPPGTAGVGSRGPAAGSVSGAGAGSAAGGGGGSGLQAVKELDRSIGELERLRLGVTPSWIIALVADERALRAYSQVRCGAVQGLLHR